jgi:hypothetical protein
MSSILLLDTTGDHLANSIVRSVILPFEAVFQHALKPIFPAPKPHLALPTCAKSRQLLLQQPAILREQYSPLLQIIQLDNSVSS